MTIPETIHRILLVDDNRSIHEDLRKFLTPHDEDRLAAAELDLFGDSPSTGETALPQARFELQSALQGQQALAMVEDAVRNEQRFTLAFVDVRMPPGWNGIETIQRLWQVDPDLEVVICTAYSDYSWQEIVTQLGHTDRFLILKKPFEGVEVRQLAMSLTAKAALRQAQAHQLATLERAVAERSADLRAAMEAAEQGSRAKSEFLANMSHEIRTPMTAILGCSDLVSETVECCHQCPLHATCEVRVANRQHIQAIQSNGEHLLQLINDILDLSKVEAGKMPIDLVRCSTFGLLAEIASLMRVRAEAKHLRLELDLVGPLPESVLVDPLRLRQILVNLVGNAIKFTDHGTVRITVRIAQAGGPPHLRFDVTDTGIGLSDEQIDGLFQAFIQVDNSATRRFGGTGLGLAISKRLTEAMGGRIEVRSEPGKGSTFSVTVDPGSLDGICLVQNAQEALLACPSTVSEVAQESLVLHGRVLLAEDGPDNQRLFSFLLTRAGAEVHVAENGKRAMELALAASAERGNRLDASLEPFDVILMDMQMPVMDGYEATRQLRAQGYTGPIVALTAHAMAEDRQKCLDAGCNDFATKPIDRRTLLATVDHWMARRHTTDDFPDPTTTENTAMPRTFVYSQLATDPDLSELVDLFVQEMPDRIQTLENHAASRDWNQLTRTAHQIKGAAGSYGFGEITPYAARLEAAAREALQEEAILASLNDLLSLCRRVRSGTPQAEEPTGSPSTTHHEGN